MRKVISTCMNTLFIVGYVCTSREENGLGLKVCSVAVLAAFQTELKVLFDGGEVFREAYHFFLNCTFRLFLACCKPTICCVFVRV